MSNVLRTASAMLDNHEQCIEWDHLPDDIAHDLRQTEIQDAKDTPNLPGKNLQSMTMDAMQQALADSNGNVSQAARQLGISRQTLYRKLVIRSDRI